MNADSEGQLSLTDEPVKAALTQVEAELAEVEPIFEQLRLRVGDLRRARVALRHLLGLHDEGSDGDTRSRDDALRGGASAYRVNRDRYTARERRPADRRAAAELEAATTALVAARERAIAAQVEDLSSTDRVVELLREARGRAVTRAAITEEFARRGWVDDAWQTPHAAIRMAIRRAADRPDVAATEDGLRWVGTDDSPAEADAPGQLDNGGDA